MNTIIYDINAVENIMKAINGILEDDTDLEVNKIENISNPEDESDSLDFNYLEFEEKKSFNSGEEINEKESNDEENYDLGKNDYEKLLEDANLSSSLLLDRLLNKSNIDNYKNIIEDLRKKMKRVSVTGEA